MKTFNNSNKKEKEDQLVTLCKICWLSIFSYQPYTWICANVIGFVHVPCLVKVEKDDANLEEETLSSSL